MPSKNATDDIICGRYDDLRENIKSADANVIAKEPPMTAMTACDICLDFQGK